MPMPPRLGAYLRCANILAGLSECLIGIGNLHELTCRESDVPGIPLVIEGLGRLDGNAAISRFRELVEDLSPFDGHFACDRLPELYDLEGRIRRDPEDAAVRQHVAQFHHRFIHAVLRVLRTNNGVEFLDDLIQRVIASEGVLRNPCSRLHLVEVQVALLVVVGQEAPKQELEILGNPSLRWPAETLC